VKPARHLRVWARGRILVYQRDHLLTLFGFKYGKYLYEFLKSSLFAFGGSQFQSCYQPTPWSSRSSEADTNQLHGAESFLRYWYQPVPWSRVIVEKLIVATSEAFPRFVGIEVPVVESKFFTYLYFIGLCAIFCRGKSACVSWTYTDGNENALTSFSVDVKKKVNLPLSTHEGI
jgi:hypothetical protein